MLIFPTFAILARKATSTTSENERRPEVTCSLSSCYANDVLWELIFDEEQYSYNQVNDLLEKLKNDDFTLFS